MMKKIINIVFILLLLVGCENNKEDVVELPEEVEQEEEIKEPEVYKASLIMAGDCLIHDSVYNANKVGDNDYDFTYALSDLKEIVSKYDIAYYNQESILGGKEYGLSNYPALNSPKEAGEAFVDAGFNLVSLANNHTLDRYGSDGKTLIESSHDFWASKKNVITAGSYLSEEERNEIRIGEVNNITYGLLSYTYGTNGYTPRSGEEYLVNYIDKEIIKKDVENYRDKVDVLMVAMHWGEEYNYIPTNYQKDLAQFLADLDVDIVIGNHAHVIEPIEWINDTLVIYALGNIISGQYFSVQTLTGALCSLDIVKTINPDGSKGVVFENVEAQLVYTLNQEEKWKVTPYNLLDETNLKDHDKYFEFFKGILKGSVEDEVIDMMRSASIEYLNTYVHKSYGVQGVLADGIPKYTNISVYNDLKVK